jgi:hypothetical protein
MKINGRVIDRPENVLVVIPRSQGDLVFEFQVINDYEKFEKLCPEPQPPKKSRRSPSSGEMEPYQDVSDPGYIKQLDEWGEKRINWSFLTSISATRELEWSKVQMHEPGTWHQWRDDLKDIGFNVPEINMIFRGYLEANTLDETKLKEARDRFLASRHQQAVIQQ